ncbi:MAG: DNA polymerase III subunit delta [Candidatus Moraniibacteriota bacterium]
MIIFLHGGDSFLVNERRGVLQKAFMHKYPQGELFIFDFEDQGTLDDVKRSLAACKGGLFASRKMVVFLHPFALGEAAEKPLLDFLEAFVKKDEDGMTLLFVHPGKIKKTHPLARLLTKQADKEELLEKPEEKNMGAYIKRELASIDTGASFSREALQLFGSSIGADTARIRTELQKLSAFKPEGIFEAADVALLVSGLSENVIFEALDALGRGDKRKALFLFHREASGPEGAYPLLSMCAWQVRRLLQVREVFDTGTLRAADIAARTKLPPFVVQKMLGTISNFSTTRIKQGLVMLADLDTTLKQGGMDPHVALDLFIWKF